jgi:hypothetical protein
MDVSDEHIASKRKQSSGMWRRLDIVLTDISEERIASIYRVEEKINKSAICTCSRWFFACGFTFFYYPEDGGDTLLRNVD